MELLKAFRILHASMPEARLIVAGDGPERKTLERYIQKTDLQRAVELRGKIPEQEKPSLLASADIACFPALHGESFGIVLIEAMAAGAKVVLGGDNPGYRSIMGDRPELLVEPSDSVKLASRLKHFLTEKPAIEAAHRWQAQSVKKYDVTRIGPVILDIYYQAIAKRTSEVT